VILSSLGDVLNKETPAFPRELPCRPTPSHYRKRLQYGCCISLGWRFKRSGCVQDWVVDGEELEWMRLKAASKLRSARCESRSRDSEEAATA
jgi:hypothetical protein